MKTSLQAFPLSLRFNKILFISRRDVLIKTLFIIFSLFYVSVAFTQTTQTFPATTTWFCPAGVTSVIAECWGGGGAGGGATGNPAAGGGGAGGSYVKNTAVTVVPGTTYTITIGNGAVGTTGAGPAGGDSWFINAATVMAKGGNGGSAAATNSTTAGGATALSAGNIGFSAPFNYYGGAGGTGGASGASGGGGGSSAGTGSNGNNASGITGGAAVVGGGAGVNGSTTAANGANNTNIGGGGAGARTNTITDRAGGNGGNGQVKITYTQLTYKSQLVGMALGSSTWCPGETRNVTIQIKNIGTATWTNSSPDINIGVKWNTNGTSWADYYIRVDAGNLAPGATGIYSLPVTASNNVAGTYTTPLAAGTNNLIFDVVYEGLSWFGNNGGGVGPGNTVFTSPALTISALPAAPTGAGVQTFCGSSNPSVSNLAATGTSITWYNTPSGGTALAAGTLLVNGTHYYASQTNASGCEGTARLNVMAVLNADASISLSSSPGTDAQTLCVNTPVINITYAIAGTGTGATVTGLPPGLATSYSGGTFIITGTPTLAGTYNYTVTTTGPCINPTLSGSVIVNPDATLTLTSGIGTNSQTICINNPLTPITYAIGGDGNGAFITGGVLPAGVTGSYSGGVFTISGTPTVPGLYNYTITALGSSCADLSVSGTIMVNNDATISLSSASGTDVQTLCVNTALSTISYAIAGGGTGATVTGLPSGLSGSYSSGIFTISGSPTVPGNFNYTVTATGPCIKPSLSGNITVNTAGTISLSSGPGTDAQTVCINNPLAAITYTIGGDATSASITAGSLPAGVTGSFSGGTFSISGTPTAAGVFNYTVTVAGSACANLSATGTITVNNNATISLSSATGTDAQSVCINTAIINITYNIGSAGTGATVTGLPSGVSGSYSSGLFTISGTPTVTGSFSYTITTTGPCLNPSLAGTVMVSADATITLASGAGTNSQVKCINNAITTISYNIGGAGTGASLSAGSFPAGVTGTFSAGVYSISGIPTVAGIFNYTITASGSSCANFSASGTITVTADATIILSSAPGTNAQTLCVNTVLTNITYAVGGSATGATVIGLPAGLTTSFAGSVFTISGTPTATGTFNYTVTTTGPCIKPALGGSITVMANSTISLSSGAGTNNQVRCINVAISNITFAIGGGATGAIVTGLPAGISGVYNAGVFTISGTATVSGTFPYTVTTTGPCINPSSGGTITVNDDATISLTSTASTTSQTVCINTAITPITYIIGGGGTGATASGLPAGVTGAYNAGTKIYTISGTPTVSGGPFSYIVTTTGPCVKPALGGTITVLANSTIVRTSAAATTTQTVCINNAITNIVYTIGGAATGATITGLPAGVTGTLSGVTFTISGTPGVSGLYSYTVTTTGPCVNPSLGGTITVNDNATIALTSAASTTSQTLCINTAISNITYLIGGGGTGATVTGLPAGVTGSYNAGTKIYTISGTPSVSGGPFNYTVTTTGPCIKPALGGSITVTPNASISFTSPAGTNAQTVCTNTAITNITYAISGSGTGANVTGMPAGVTGLFSGGVFTISGTPTVPGTFNYTVTTTGPCGQVSLGGSLIVKAIPTGTLTAAETSGNVNNDNIICTGAPVTFTATAGYSAYKFYVNGIVVQNAGPSNTYNTTSLVNGDVVSVQVFNSLNCATFFNTLTVTVNTSPAGSLTVSENSGTVNDNIICPGSNVIFTATAGFTNYNFKVNGIAVQSSSSNTYNSSSLSNGASITVDVTNANGCATTFGPQVITVTALPAGTLSASSTTVCSGVNVTFTATAGFPSYEFKVNGINVQGPGALNTYSSNTLTNASVVTVTVTNASGCVATFNPILITVNPLPTGTIGVTENSGTPNDNSICSGSSVTFTFTNGFQNYDFRVNNISQQAGGANVYSNATLINGDIVSVVVTNGTSCTATFTAPSVTVIPSPTGSLTASSNAVCSGDNVTFTATAGFVNYHFYINGSTVQNGPSNIYSSISLANGDVITVDVTGSNNCITTFNPVVIMVNSLPSGTLTIMENSGINSNDGIICTGANVIFTAPSGFTSYNFLLNGVSVQNGASNIYASSTLVSGDNVSVAVTNFSGCIALLNSYTITVNSLPAVLPVTGTLSVCVNNTTALADATPGGVWSSLNASIAMVDAVGVVTGISAGSVSIIYTVTNANWCFTQASASVTVNGMPVIAAITGNLNICANDSSQLSTITSGGSWSSSNTVIATVNASGMVYGISAGTSVINYTVTNGNGCTSSQSAVVSVNALPIVDVISGTMDVCINSTTILTNTATGGTWNSSDISIATIDPSSGLVTGIAAGSATISYTVININNCSTTVTAVVTVHQLPIPTLSGPNPICPNSTATYTTETGQFNYAWTFSGGTLISGGTSTDNTITILWDQPGIRNVFVNYTDVNGCAGATSATLTTSTGTVPSLSGTTPVCLNSNGNYITQASQVNYTWVVNGGTVVSGGTSLDNTAIINWTTPGTGTVSINFTDINGCTGAIPTIFSVTVNPLPTVITHNQTVCAPSTVNLTAPAITAGSSPGLIFTYWIDVAATIAYPTPGTAGAGTYYIKGTTAAGCYTIQPITVTVTTPPFATIVYTGGPFCTSGGPVTVTQAGSTGGTYAAAAGLTINTSNGTITPATSTNGTYTVSYIIAAAGGCSVYTTTTQVTITAAPFATISYAGGSFCTNSAPVSATFSGTGGGVYGSTPGLNINAATGSITPATSIPGTYTVNYTIAPSGGCGVFTTSTSVTITAQPGAAISYTGNPFCTSAGPVTVTRTGTAGGVYTSTAGLTINNATGTITPGTSSAGTYLITYNIAASGGCASYTTNTSVTITQAPTAVAGTPVVMCSNAGTVNITAGSSASNQTSITWSSSGSGGTIANSNSLTLATYTPSAADIAAGSIILTLTANGNGNCPVAISTKTVTINAVPASFIITPANASVCQGTVQSFSASTSVSSTGSMTFNSVTNNIAIPDNSAAGALSAINVSGIPAGAIINSVSVKFNITHGYDADLVLNLKAPNANKLNLVNLRGGGGDNFTNTIISSASANPVNAGAAPFTNTYAADAANGVGATNNVSNVAAFTSLYTTPNGNWTFSAQDDVGCHGGALLCLLGLGTYYTGTLNNWSITINYTVPNSPLAVTWSPATNLYTDPGATTAYVGQALSTVYAKAVSTTTYTATATNAANCSTNTTATLTVNPVPVVTITADYCAVPGKVRLTANAVPTASNYLWSTGEVTQSIDVDVSGTFTVNAFVVSGCFGSATINVAQELVDNGNFELGNVGFISPPLGPNQYQYRADIAGNMELYPEGLYGVGTDGQNYHPSFFGKDHTTGSGNYMLINGFPNGNPQPIVWQETVTVLPNTTYYFSAWGMSLNSVGPFAQLQFNVNGAQVGTTATLTAGVNNNSNNGWTRFYGTWTSGPTTTNAVISITDLQNAPGGNDFGLDDVSFATLSTFITLESALGSDAQVICKNTPISNIVYNVGNGNPSGPTVTGLPPGVTSAYTGNSLTISGTPTSAGTFTYTITTTGCNIISTTGTITVRQQTLILSAGSSSPTACVNTPVSISYTLGGTATAATVTGLPAGISGSLSGNIFTISGSTALTGSFPYSVTTSGSCTPVTLAGTINIQSQSITLASGNNNQSVCIGSAIATIQYNVGGTSSGASVTGLPPGVTGNFISGIFIISGTPTSSAGSPYSYTVTTSGACAGVTAIGSITVIPGASITITSGTNNTTVCKNTAMSNIVYSVSNASGATISGLPAGVSGVFSSGVFTISGTPTVSGTFNYTITSSGGCATTTSAGTIIVQVQSIGLTSGIASPSLCVNTPMTNIVYTFGGSATGAAVTGLPAGINWSVSGNTITISGTPTVPGGAAYTITTSGACATVTAGGTITVQPGAVGGTLTSVSICSGASGTLTLSGQAGTIIRWEYSTNGGASWTPISNITISQSYTNITIPTLYRVVIDNGCGNAFSTPATVGIHNYWTGNISTDWNTAANWSDNQLPSTSCADVYIPGTAPNQPTLNTGTASITNIHIFPGAVLTINNTGILKIAGVINNSGVFDVTNGTLEMNGTSSPQLIAGSLFKDSTIKNLVISNNVNISGTLNNKMNILGTLSFGNNTADLNTGDNIVLRSTMLATSNVGKLNAGNVITGNVVVERHIPNHSKAWQFLAVPVGGNQTVNQAWQDTAVSANQNRYPGYGTMLTGSVPGAVSLGFDVYTPAGPSIKIYNSMTDGYNGIPNTTTFPIANPKGYMVLVRGDRSVIASNQAATATTMRTKGKLFTPADAPSIINVAAGTFESIGNPYASAIDFSLITKTGGVQPDFFYMWDPRLTTTTGSGANSAYGLGGFQTFSWNGGGFDVTPGGGSYSGNNRNIESGQAFFVRAPLNGGTVSFSEACKTNGSNNVNRIAGLSKQLRTNLHVITAIGPVLVDGNLLQYDGSYSNSVDLYDALKLNNSSENVGLISGGKKLAVERRSVIQPTDTIFFSLGQLRVQQYEFEFIASDLEQPGLTAFLEDNYLHSATALSLQGTTTVRFNVINDGGSYAPDRFRIVFKRLAPLPVTITSISATRNSDKTVAINWKVESETSMKLYTIERSADGRDFTGIITASPTRNNGGRSVYASTDMSALASDNFYRIRALSLSGLVQYSSIVKVAPLRSVASVEVYPNPVTGKRIQVEFTGQPAGTYKLVLINGMGQPQKLSDIELAEGRSIHVIVLPQVFASGIYRLQLTGPGNLVILKTLHIAD